VCLSCDLCSTPRLFQQHHIDGGIGVAPHPRRSLVPKSRRNSAHPVHFSFAHDCRMILPCQGRFALLRETLIKDGQDSRHFRSLPFHIAPVRLECLFPTFVQKIIQMLNSSGYIDLVVSCISGFPAETPAPRNLLKLKQSGSLRPRKSSSCPLIP